MSKYKTTIGIEIHCELKTGTKMFSGAPVKFGETANTCTSVVDLAMPGTLPSVNKEAVRLAIKACTGLHCDIDPLVKFDRKNYYYSDLPKGFQITQQFHPIGRDGYVEIETEEGSKRIRIERIHMEEDTAKQFHRETGTYIDFNRAGVPLVEIVSRPDMHSAEEAAAYVDTLRQILLYLNVSDVKMKAPDGVVLKSISLVANNGSSRYVIDEKPFSGNPMEFKVPLRSMQGRVYFSLRGNLIKKDSRDAEVIITDNIQKIVFSETPEFECQGWLYVSVKSKSTSGEEYSHSFEVKSADADYFAIAVPQSELYWTPISGTASTLEISLGSGATAWSPNTTFDCKITDTAIGNSSGDPSTLKITIPNSPGSLNSQKLQLYVRTSYFGTWEDVTIEPYNLTTVYTIIETE